MSLTYYVKLIQEEEYLITTQSIHYVKELDLELEYKMVSLLLSISLLCSKIVTPVSPLRANKETPFQEV